MIPFLKNIETNRLFEEFLAPFESACLMNAEGQVLYTKYETISDLGTFSTCINTIRQYFPLKDGDLVLTNDPYCGGTLLSVMTLVTCIVIKDQTLFIAARTRFRMRVSFAKKVDDEGIRIPPTPVATARSLNSAILNAIAAHPAAPNDFQARIADRSALIWQQIDLFKAWVSKNPEMISKNRQKQYLTDSRDYIAKVLHDYSFGDAKFEVQFDSGETIRLHLEVTKDGFHFDFAGTSNSQRLFLTNSTTLGTCVGALLTFLEKNLIVNDALFSFVKVTTPQGSFLNAKYPSPLFEGTIEGTTLLAAIATHALLKVCKHQSFSLNGACAVMMSYEFPSKQIYMDAIAGGTGATSMSEGVDGHYLWSLNKLQPSIEEIERIYPIRILYSGIRFGSGGKGKFKGGDGILRETLVMSDCTLKWLISPKNQQSKDGKAAATGHNAELHILRNSGAKETIPQLKGEIALYAGDKIIASSAGGGGFGKSE